MIGAERVDFVLIPTRDLERASRFYGETLGFERSNDHPSWAEYESGNVTLAIGNPEDAGWDFSPVPFGGVAIRVADVASARANLEEAGVEFHGETIDSGVCHMAFFTDADGNGLLLHHRYAPHADGSEP
ncbi:MAG: VOC family protein [Actinomycetota bacterium]|nr:VOC family protein [Actinomycetota bacterium]